MKPVAPDSATLSSSKSAPHKQRIRRLNKVSADFILPQNSAVLLLTIPWFSAIITAELKLAGNYALGGASWNISVDTWKAASWS